MDQSPGDASGPGAVTAIRRPLVHARLSGGNQGQRPGVFELNPQPRARGAATSPRRRRVGLSRTGRLGFSETRSRGKGVWQSRLDEARSWFAHEPQSHPKVIDDLMGDLLRSGGEECIWLGNRLRALAGGARRGPRPRVRPPIRPALDREEAGERGLRGTRSSGSVRDFVPKAPLAGPSGGPPVPLARAEARAAQG